MYNKAIMIKDYEYVEFATDEGNANGQSVLAIYGIDTETLSKLFAGVVIKWNSDKWNLYENNGVDDKPMIWNGEVYACFTDFVLVYLY